MSTSTIMKKRTNIFIVTVLFLIVGLITTYVIFSSSILNNNAVINNKNLKVIFENGKKGIQFGGYPMTFQQGVEESPSNIYKVINKNNSETEYQIIVTDISESVDKIDMNKIVVAINDNEIKMLSDVYNGVIYTSTLNKNEEEIINLKFWLDKESADSSDLSKSLKLNVDIKEK